MMKRTVTTLANNLILPNNEQILVNRATETFDLPLHDHEFIELSYIAEGTGFHHIDTDVTRITKGELTFIPIGTPHVFRPASPKAQTQPLIVYNCVFTTAYLIQLLAFCKSRDTVSFIEMLLDPTTTHFTITDSDESIERLFLHMHREYSLKKLGYEECLLASFLQLLITIQRYSQSDIAADSTITIPKHNQQQSFEQLLHYIDQHYNHALTLPDLAAKSKWSERQLQRLFLQHTEQNFSHYLQSIRIQKSRELLRNSQHKIATIAHLIGYKDVGHFLSIFKRMTGTTPSAYRKSLR